MKYYMVLRSVRDYSIGLPGRTGIDLTMHKVSPESAVKFIEKYAVVASRIGSDLPNGVVWFYVYEKL